MLFDTTQWRLTALSSPIITLNAQNTIKVAVLEAIAQNEATKVEIQIIEQDGRNPANVLMPYTEMAGVSPYFTYTFTPAFTPTPNMRVSVNLKVTYTMKNTSLVDTFVGEVIADWRIV